MNDTIRIFFDAIKKADTIEVDTFWGGQKLHIGNEDIMRLWSKIWDGLPKHVINDSITEETYYFRNDSTLYYMWTDSVTVYIGVCHYWGWVDGKQVFQLMDIDSMIKDEDE